ncbi:MAG: hypothetical protein CL670_02985 [Balneola sp.]|nr:hypothetical protein [Balneola sp.]MBE78098.1 hypothetical protein [Balneola sp.]|tara:strand:- start:2130 stop:4874 length:2745 start_codon:yes stop_codon:yes gene_type:complete
MGFFKKGTTLLILMLAAANAYGQYTIQHQAPVALQKGSTNTLEFSLPGITEADLQQANLFYRFDGDFSYQQQEVRFQNGGLTASLDIRNQNVSTVEYYLEVQLISGETLFFPNNLPSENPVEVEVVEQLSEQKEQLEGVDYTILSPRPGNGVTTDDVVIALALFYEKSDLPPGVFKLLIDGKDVTAEADTSAYYISYIPKDLGSGPHTISLEYQTEGKVFAVTDWRFAVVSPGQASFQGFGPSRIPQGRVELTARNQIISGDVNNAYTGRTNINGAYGDFRYSLNGYLTSQESVRLQPQNRYGIDLAYGDWWDFEAGHVYPTMSQFTISGRRVHGLNTSLHLLNENINLQFIYGELDREITNQYDSLLVEDVVVGADSVVDQNFLLTYQEGGRGSFQRKVTGGRIGFGNEEKFQIGIQALRIQDDTTSIFNVRDYLDLASSSAVYGSNLNSDDIDSLLANPDRLDVRGGNVKPKGNLVAGADFKMGLLNNRVRLESEAVISALNNNIYDGPLTVQRAEDLGFDVNQKTADLLEQLSWLIIVNENMNTLPFRISEDESGELSGNAFFPTGILATNSELSLRYPNNNFRLQYRWIGPGFNSLANSTIRKDVAGFTISDRLNFLSNRMYVTLGYENLNDNVTGTRDATTNTNTYRTNVSWYPVDRSLPRVSAGLRYRTRDNGVERQNFLLSDDLVNAAVQNIRQEQRNINGQDTLIILSTATPRSNYSVNINTSITQQFSLMNARNDISLSYTNLNTTDEVFAYGDIASSAFSLSLNSRFSDLPLETQFGFTYNNTEAGSGLNKINIFGMYAGGNFRMMEDKLTVNGRLAITQNKTENRMLLIRDNPNSDELNDNVYDDYFILGDDITKSTFSTFVIQAGARYNFNEYHALVFDSNLTNVSGRANDRIVQLRYVFSF